MAKVASKRAQAPLGCELEGDNCLRCGLAATKEVKFPVDYPRLKWLRACDECIDRRKDVFTMEIREISEDTLFQDLLAFAKDYYREYEPVSDVNEMTEAMVDRAKALVGRSKKETQPPLPPIVAKAPDRSDQMRELFGKICNKENWKLPINALIKAEDENLAIDAIVFMTGGGDVVVTQSAEQKKKGLVKIQAPGYYAIIGS